MVILPKSISKLKPKIVTINNQFILFIQFFLDLSIPPLDYYDSNIFSISSNMGTFNCNWIAFSTQVYLNQKNSQNYQLFLHLPPRQNASYLANQIKILLENNHLL